MQNVLIPHKKKPMTIQPTTAETNMTPKREWMIIVPTYLYTLLMIHRYMDRLPDGWTDRQTDKPSTYPHMLLVIHIELVIYQ